MSDEKTEVPLRERIAFTPMPQHLRLWFFRQCLRACMWGYLLLLRLARAVGPTNKLREADGYDILLTGSFYSDNWLVSHLRPLALSRACSRVRIVSTWPIPPLEKVEAIYPPQWLIRLLGKVGARMLTFVWVGLRTRPHFVGGFHLLLNGMLAALLGRVIGARSLYFCVGGPAEVLGGGIASENRLFERLQTEDIVIERQLLRVVNAFDLVISMGTGAVAFFRQRGITIPIHVISGGIDTRQFHTVAQAPAYDLILVCRLATIKRVDVFLRSIWHVKLSVPDVTATIVGDGALRQELEQLATRLELKDTVHFAGYQKDVGSWLRRAKVFVLTSDSEGLPLSTMEAMMCGLPVVASAVGDLADLVNDGVNGYLINERTAENFATRIVELLTDAERLGRFAKASRLVAERHNVRTVTQTWDSVLGAETIASSHKQCAA